VKKGSTAASVAAAAAAAPAPLPAAPVLSSVSSSFRTLSYENGLITACNNVRCTQNSSQAEDAHVQQESALLCSALPELLQQLSRHIVRVLTSVLLSRLPVSSLGDVR
jgi:hypothetical protein